MVKKREVDVRIKWAKKRPARVVSRGEQVSEIEWLDTGILQAIPNDQLDFLGENKRIKTERERRK